MVRETTVMALVGLAGLVMMLGGCGMAPPAVPTDVNIPATVRQAQENARAIVAPDAGALDGVEPGTVRDDLATLDGCWALALDEPDVQAGLKFFVVLHFDSAAGTYTEWAFFGTSDGALWSTFPLISSEEGTYTITSDSTLQLQPRRFLANVGAGGSQVTQNLREVPVENASDLDPEPALVTLSGDEMLFYVNAATPADVDSSEPRPLFRRFDCPQ